MSFDYRAHFALERPISAPVLHSVLSSIGLRLASANSAITYKNGKLQEQPGTARDWLAFVNDASSPNPSACGRFEAEDLFFDMGFASIPGPGPEEIYRMAILEISDSNLARLGYAAEDADTDSLRWFVRLFIALGASSLVMGIEASPSQAVQFISGNLPLQEMDESVCLAIGAPISSSIAMVRNPGTREVDVEGTRVLVRYFSGVDDYF